MNGRWGRGQRWRPRHHIWINLVPGRERVRGEEAGGFQEIRISLTSVSGRHMTRPPLELARANNQPVALAIGGDQAGWLRQRLRNTEIL